MNRRIAISGLGGQGVLFITRLLAEAALIQGLDVLSSETHGMAMRGGAVISHLKAGPFHSPLIRAGHADAVLFLAEENLAVHGELIGPRTRILVNGAGDGKGERVDAFGLAVRAGGRRQSANLVLLGYALGRGALFAEPGAVRQALAAMAASPEALTAGEAALGAGVGRRVERGLKGEDASRGMSARACVSSAPGLPLMFLSGAAKPGGVQTRRPPNPHRCLARHARRIVLHRLPFGFRGQWMKCFWAPTGPKPAGPRAPARGPPSWKLQLPLPFGLPRAIIVRWRSRPLE